MIRLLLLLAGLIAATAAPLAGPVYTTAEVAAQLRMSPKKVREVGRAAGVGFKVGGKSGWRYEPADIEAIKAHMRPTAPVQKRRRRRSA